MNLFSLMAMLCTGSAALLAVLKLAHVIAWRWLWVTSPLWGGALAALALMLYVLARIAIDDRNGQNPFE